MLFNALCEALRNSFRENESGSVLRLSLAMSKNVIGRKLNLHTHITHVYMV